MLVRRILAVSVLVAAAALSATAGGSAHADGGASCPPEILWCTITGSGGGSSGSGSGGGSGAGCSYKGTPVACYLPNLGYYRQSNGCYYRRRDPQPDPSSPAWIGHTPGTGAFYDIYCATGPAPWGSGPVVFTAGQWLPAGGVSPAQLAQQALARIRLDNPAIGIAPEPGGPGGLVGLPVWLWTPSDVHTWGPLSASATSGGISVTIQARVWRIVWRMGDGHTVTCAGPGTKYAPSDGGNASPTCGYRYAKPSTARPGGTYRVTATTTWHVVWSGGGDSGVIITTRTSSVRIRINQAQVIVK